MIVFYRFPMLSPKVTGMLMPGAMATAMALTRLGRLNRMAIDSF